MEKYWQILKQYKGGLAVSPLLVLITVLCETVQPMFMAEIIDNGVMPRDLSVITRVGTFMILISLAGLFVNIINVYVSSRIGIDLRTRLFDKIQQLSFFDIDKFSSASLVTRLTSDISRIQQIVLMSMRLLLRSPLMLAMAVFFVVRINRELAVVLIAAIPILGGSVYLILSKGFPYFLKVQQKVDQLNGVVRENLINIRVVKSFVREDFETKKFTRSSEELRDMVIRASNIVVSGHAAGYELIHPGYPVAGRTKSDVRRVEGRRTDFVRQLSGAGFDVTDDAFHDFRYGFYEFGQCKANFGSAE